MFYLALDANDRWHELNFELRKSMNVSGHRFDEWHNLEMFVIPLCERDVFHQAARDVWVECNSFRALNIPESFVFLFMTSTVQPGTSLSAM